MNLSFLWMISLYSEDLLKKAPDSQEEWIKNGRNDFATFVIFSRDIKIIN